jgi:aromatic-L-amino-acid decarboxylase
VYRSLPDSPPEHPESFDAILRDLDEVVLPGVVHWQSPGWFAFFPANVSAPSILGDLVASGLGQQGMLWATSPACTEIEMRVLDWLVDLMQLPQGWKTTGPGGGVIQMSASDSTHLALVVARELARGRAAIDDQVVYASTQAHSSVEKGARIAGFRELRLLDTDDAHAMQPESLRAAIRSDMERGLTPAAVVSCVGTTGTTAVDPVRAIGEIARHNDMWHHVDAAFAGSAMLCEEFRHHQDGLELADSYVFNPHKWMFTNFDCSVFYVADRRPLIDTMTILPPYLRTAASDSSEVLDYRDWHVPLGRRFRALKLWFVLRWYGAEGLRHHIREHVRLARGLADLIEADPRLELAAPVPFSLVCFRHVAGDERTEALAAALNATGDVHLTSTQVGERRIIRVSIGQTHTEQRHVDRLWRLIDELA